MSSRTKDKQRFEQPLQSSFLNAEKDLLSIVQRLFTENREFSEYLKRLLVINTKDCIDDLESEVYKEELKKCNLSYLKDKQYIRIEPKLKFRENEEVKSYLIITLDNFTPNGTNDYYRDCHIMIDIICHTDYWDLGNFRLRPYKIAGYVDSLLNQARLSGIGTLQFISCNEIVLNENLSGLCLVYRAVHGNDDKLPTLDEDED